VIVACSNILDMIELMANYPVNFFAGRRYTMKTYPLEISLESPTIAASGEGWNAVIDTDIVF
jgi:hypothetical protein